MFFVVSSLLMAVGMYISFKLGGKNKVEIFTENVCLEAEKGRVLTWVTYDGEKVMLEPFLEGTEDELVTILDLSEEG
jgi:hypothetical protein